MHEEKEILKQRIIGKIRITPSCWVWTGCKDADGYGVINVAGKTKKAHRLSYEIYISDIPNGLFVCHKCDNPSCVNPDHLWAGTPRQNSDDKMQKGRWGEPRCGEIHPLAKLTDEDIYAIRADTRPQTEISKQYGIVFSAVSAIKLRKKWSHLPKRDDEVEHIKHAGSGKRNPILTDEQQLAIRSDTRSQIVIGADYGVSQSVISKIKLGKGCYAKNL